MNSSDRSVWLPRILAVALVIRLLLFTGIQGNDDANYFMGAQRFARGEGLSPTDLLQTRVAYVAPLALLFGVCGAGIGCQIALSLLASLALVALAYLLGRQRYSENVGRGASLFVTLFPLDIVYATQSNTDGPLAVWLGMCAWLLGRVPLSPTPMGKATRAVFAGLALGAAHLTKESGILLALLVLPFVATRGNLRWIGVAAAVAAMVVGLELLTYQIWIGDALHRVHVARAIQSETVQGGFLSRVFALPSLCFNPLGVTFPYMGGLMALSAAACIWAIARDRARSGSLAAWWLGSGLLLALFPISLVPYRAAIQLQPRMFAVLILPGAVLAAAFWVEFLAPRFPRAARAGVAVAAALALVCAVRIHQDSLRWRRGPEWAHKLLSGMPGSRVVTDSRTALMLRMLSGDAPPYELTRYETSDRPPGQGALLLQCDRTATASRHWDHRDPPLWWASESPPREIVAELRLTGVWRLRGPRGQDELTVIRRIRGAE